ncbi:MAG: MerR family transcriptional regulator [Bacteroidetes bacterium]|nr:MerR family transcriptional regulator [Bacteroidota bacterium]
MAIYSISDLEKLSGIKAHTIRVWEQRYGIINPERTETNIRYYKDEDLKLLLNIALLKRNGLRISKIAKMDRGEIEAKVAEVSEINFEYGTQLDALTLSMIEMDELKFERIISTNIQQIGFERTMLEVIQPFLDKLSVLWLTGSINPVQESFIGYLIRQKLIVAIDKLELHTGPDVRKFILYLPEGERQELSLLFMHFMLKLRGHQVLYIGQEMAITDLADVQKIHNPDFIFTMISETFSKEPVHHYIDHLSKQFQNTEILISGYQVVAQEVESKDNIRVLHSLQETIEFLDTVK